MLIACGFLQVEVKASVLNAYGRSCACLKFICCTVHARFLPAHLTSLAARPCSLLFCLIQVAGMQWLRTGYYSNKSYPFHWAPVWRAQQDIKWPARVLPSFPHLLSHCWPGLWAVHYKVSSGATALRKTAARVRL